MDPCCHPLREGSERHISSSCHPPTNQRAVSDARSNFKNGGDNFFVYYFVTVTGRYFEFLSIEPLDISWDEVNVFGYLLSHWFWYIPKKVHIFKFIFNRLTNYLL